MYLVKNRKKILTMDQNEMDTDKRKWWGHCNCGSIEMRNEHELDLSNCTNLAMMNEREPSTDLVWKPCPRKCGKLMTFSPEGSDRAKFLEAIAYRWRLPERKNANDND
jgi:hypothetical protein